MKIACGTDIIEISRVEQSMINAGDKFAKEVFTKQEIDYCESKGKVKYQHYAARFAAKEAIFKAISNMLESKYSITWQNIQILNDKNGRPYIDFIDAKLEQIKSIDISLSHCKEYAVANVNILYESF